MTIKRFKFKEYINYIKRNYTNMTDIQMAENLGINVAFIKRYRIANRLLKREPISKIWSMTKHQKDFIENNMNKYSRRELSEMLGLEVDVINSYVTICNIADSRFDGFLNIDKDLRLFLYTHIELMSTEDLSYISGLDLDILNKFKKFTDKLNNRISLSKENIEEIKNNPLKGIIFYEKKFNVSEAVIKEVYTKYNLPYRVAAAYQEDEINIIKEHWNKYNSLDGLSEKLPGRTDMAIYKRVLRMIKDGELLDKNNYFIKRKRIPMKIKSKIDKMILEGASYKEISNSVNVPKNKVYNYAKERKRQLLCNTN